MQKSSWVFSSQKQKNWTFWFRVLSSWWKTLYKAPTIAQIFLTSPTYLWSILPWSPCIRKWGWSSFIFLNCWLGGRRGMFQGYTPKVFNMEPANVKKHLKNHKFFAGIPCFSLQGLHLPEKFRGSQGFWGEKNSTTPTPQSSLWTCLHHRQRSCRLRNRWAWHRHLSGEGCRGRLTVAGSDWGQIRSGFFQQKHLGDVPFFANVFVFWPESSLYNSLNLKILGGHFWGGKMPVGKTYHQLGDSPVQTKTESFHTQGYPPLIVSKVFWGQIPTVPTSLNFRFFDGWWRQ